MLARLLLHQNRAKVDVVVFEGEAALDFRSQGGTLDLPEKDGQKAVREAGLWDVFQKHVRYDGEAVKFADKNYVCYVNLGGSKPGSKLSSGRPEIDRPALREMLYRSLPGDVVRWKKRLTAVERRSDGLELKFQDGTVDRGFDIIVGADGAWSKVRTLLSDTKPFYSGVGGYAFSIPDAAKRAPEVYKAVNRGSMFSYSDGKGFNAQQQGDGSIQVGTWFVQPEGWQGNCGHDVHDAAAAKEACSKQFADWHPFYHRCIAQTEDKVTPRDLYMLPVGFRWEHVPGVTLVGDAAHLVRTYYLCHTCRSVYLSCTHQMTPFAGEGVNLAFMDCMKLAQAILSSAADATADAATNTALLDKNVRAFEEDMFARAKVTQQLTFDMMNYNFFAPGGLRGNIEKYMLRAMQDETGPWLTMLLTPLVYAYFFIFKLIW